MTGRDHAPVLVEGHIRRRESAIPTYGHGQQAAMLRALSWRTAANSAPHFVGHIQPNMHILDIGCGPGTITVDFAQRVPQGFVTGLDISDDVLQKASADASKRGITNIKYIKGSALELPFPDASFDAVHEHQVIIHLPDPVQALREMKRVCKPGGFVTARDGDSSTFIWYPEPAHIQEWKHALNAVCRANGGEPDAGRRLHLWARKAGIDPARTVRSATSWCYSTPEERAWWSNSMAEHTVGSFGDSVKKHGLGDDEDLQRWAAAWREWGADEDGWFIIVSGEILCNV